METQNQKEIYQSPVVEVIDMEIEGSILQASDIDSGIDSPSWEYGEDF